MTDILVPYSMQGRTGPFSLYSVQVKESSCDASWIAIADESTVQDNRFIEKLGHIQEYCRDTTGREIHLISKGDRKLIRRLTDATTSVLLGICVAGLRDVMHRYFRSDWKTITVTGDIELRNGRMFPEAVESIPEKYKGFCEVIKKDLEEEPEQKHLFLYISDQTPEKLGLEMPDNGHIEVKAFTSRDPLIELMAYLFEPCFDEKQERLFARAKKSVNHAYVPPPNFFKLCREASGNDWRGYIILGDRETGKSRMALELAYYLAEREYIYAPIFINDDYELEKEIIDGKSDNTTSGDNHFTKPAVAIAKRIAEKIGIEGWKPEHGIRPLNDTINKQGKPPYLLFFDDVKTVKIDDIVKAVDKIISICNCRLPMIITIHNTDSFVEAEKAGFILIQPSSLTKDGVGLLVKNIARCKKYEYKLNDTEKKYVQFIELVYTNFASFPGIVYHIVSMLNNKEVESLNSMLLEIAGENFENKIESIYRKIYSEIEKKVKYKGPILLGCKEVNEIGYNDEKITLSTLALDFLCVPTTAEFDITIEKEGGFKIWNPFDKYYAEDCSIYLVKNDRMIGYCSICPIEDDYFDNSLMNGKEIIRPAMIAPYKPEGNPLNPSGKPYEPGRKFNVYITTISIEHGSESPENYRRIFEWIFQRLKEWENRGILKDRIGISVYSDMLKKIVEQFGFLPKPNNNPIGGTVFECKREELRWLDLTMGNIEVVKWSEDKKSHSFTFDNVLKAFLEIDLAAFHELAAIKSDKKQYDAYKFGIINRYHAYKDGYIIAHEDSKIVGYVVYFPITEKFYNTFLEGSKVYDYNITSADICGLNENSNYLFIISVAILPKYQKQGISKQLSKMLLDEFSKIKIKDIVAFAISVNGEHFLKNINLKEYKDMGNGKKLMRIAL